VHRDDFFDLIDRLAASDRIDMASEVINGFMEAWGLHNVAYAALNMPAPGASRPLLSVTYSSEWQKHYAQSGYVDLDPIVRSGLGGILPVDWAEIDRGDPIIRKFFGEAQELDVGANGLSAPIRGRNGEFALFTITSNQSDREWRAMKRELLRDLMVVAFNFHAAVLRSVGLDKEREVRMPLRETSCLRWKALGKTDDEIGTILGISSHTVRFHLESARARLHTTNTTHTVARAVALGLVSMSYEPAHLMPRKGN
jgi:DNA-binding CsgD family transcriptional regulator